MFTKQDIIGNEITNYFFNKFGRSGASRREGNIDSIFFTLDMLAIRVNIFEDGNIEIHSELCLNGMSVGISAGKDIATDTAGAIKIIEQIIKANDIIQTMGGHSGNIEDIIAIADKIKSEADTVEY